MIRPTPIFAADRPDQQTIVRTCRAFEDAMWEWVGLVKRAGCSE